MSRGSGAVLDAPGGHAGDRLTEDELLSAMPRRSANREVRVGVFVLIGILAFLTVLFTMTDVGTFRGRYYLTTQVVDAGGMRRGDPVQMRGVNIGRVVGFAMVPGGVNVRLELYDEYEVPGGSRAEVKSNGLLGGMVVDVIPGSARANLEDGATLPGQVGADVFAQAAGVGSRADTVLMRVNALLSDQTIGAVGGSAVELRSLLAELNGLAAQQRAELATLTASLQRGAVGIERASAGVERATTAPELHRAVARLDSITLRMDETTRSLGRASGSLETVLTRMERGEGTLGKLSANDSLYVGLNAAASNLNQLIADIRANPKKYLSVSVF